MTALARAAGPKTDGEADNQFMATIRRAVLKDPDSEKPSARDGRKAVRRAMKKF